MAEPGIGKQVLGFFLLFLLLLSLFLLVFVPIEISKTLAVRSWQPVEVEIVRSELVEWQGHWSIDLDVRDVRTGERSGRVVPRHGDFTMNVTLFGGLIGSTLKDDLARFPQGLRTVAWRGPDGEYVLEQNSITRMVILLLGAAVYPTVVVVQLLRRRAD